MKTTHIVLLVLGIVILGYIIFVRYVIGDFGRDGRCYESKNVQINLDTIKVEEKFKVSNGEILFSNLEDTLPPLVIKVDKNNKVEYAIRLEFDDDNCISLNNLSEIRFDENDRRIMFFNGSYGEPGYIKLTKDYRFDYAYTSPF